MNRRIQNAKRRKLEENFVLELKVHRVLLSVIYELCQLSKECFMEDSRVTEIDYHSIIRVKLEIIHDPQLIPKDCKRRQFLRVIMCRSKHPRIYVDIDVQKKKFFIQRKMVSPQSWWFRGAHGDYMPSLQLLALFKWCQSNNCLYKYIYLDEYE